MRVGFGVTSLLRGLQSNQVDGIGVYTQHLLDQLATTKLDIEAICFGYCARPKEVSHFLPVPERCFPVPYQVGAVCSLLTALPFPGTNTLRTKFNLFHAPDHHIPQLRGIPVVATIMDAIPLAHPEWASARLRFAKNFAFRRMARSAQQIITISEFSKADIVHYFGIPPERISMNYLGVDATIAEPVAPEKKASVLARYGLRPGFFIFVGTIQPRKNVDRVIEAHRQLPEVVQKDCPLVIVGRNGWGMDALLPELKVLEISGRGRWLNNVPDEELHALLQSARALVYPSLYEGFGLPVLEGFAAGLPVISSNTTSIPEVAGDAALLVDPNRTDEIADAMLRVAEDDALAADLVKRGRQRLKGFTWEETARQTLAVYQQVVGN